MRAEKVASGDRGTPEKEPDVTLGRTSGGGWDRKESALQCDRGHSLAAKGHKPEFSKVTRPYQAVSSNQKSGCQPKVISLV